MTEITRAVMKRVATQAAKEAVHGTFSVLGVDMDDQDHVNAFRQDLIFARKSRKLQEKVGGRALMTFVSILTGGFLLAGWDYFKTKFGS
jgi:hypothetical protein